MEIKYKRVTTILREDYWEKMKEIAFYERKELKQLFEEMLEEYIARYDKERKRS